MPPPINTDNLGGSGNNKEILSDPFGLLSVTPLGCICLSCADEGGTSVDSTKATFSSTPRAVRSHFQQHHSDEYDLPNRLPNLSANLAAATQEATKEWRKYTTIPMLQEQHICCNKGVGGCGKQFTRPDNYKRHVKDSNGKCHLSMKAIVDRVQLKCGRWMVVPEGEELFPQQQQQLPTSLNLEECMPTAATKPLNEYATILRSFIKPHDSVEAWKKIQIPLMSSSNFEQETMDSLQKISNAQQQPSLVLRTLFQCVDYYIEHIGTILSILPGNVKNVVQNFMVNDDVDNAPSIFSERRSYKTVTSYMHHLMAFLVAHNCPYLIPYTNQIIKRGFDVERSYKYGFIPSLIYDLVCEVPDQVGGKTWLLWHALLYCYEINDGKLYLNSSGWGAQKLSTALHAVRAAVCGKMSMIKLNNRIGLAPLTDMAAKVQATYFINTICPSIRQLRVQYNLLPNSRRINFDEHENVYVDGMKFSEEKYSQLIPIIYEMFQKEFESCFEGDEWKDILNLEHEVIVSNWLQCSVRVNECHLSDLSLKEDGRLVDLQKLCALLEFSLFGFGLGVGRHMEVESIELNAFSWLQSSLFYGLVSRKTGSVQAREGRFVLHKLPAIISRCLLLTRRVITAKVGHPKEGKLFPTLPNRTYTMMTLVRSIFELGPNEGEMVQVRQFFHTLINMWYPTGLPMYGSMIASKEIAEQAGHSQQTAAGWYMSRPIAWREKVMSHYHFCLGDTSIITPKCTVHRAPRTSSEIEELIKLLFGPNSTFRNDGQKQALSVMLNNSHSHRAFLLPCGAGKTLLSLIATVDAYVRGEFSMHATFDNITSDLILTTTLSLQGEKRPTTIIVAPHINLVGHLTSEITDLLQSVNNETFWVESFTTVGQTIPTVLSDPHELPDIMVMSIPAFTNLLSHHKSQLRTWSDNGQLRHIIIDEVQTLSGESAIRVQYEHVQQASTIGVPITLLSGSLTKDVLLGFTDYYRLTNSKVTDIETVQDGDLVGRHFNFEVIPSLQTRDIVAYASRRVTSCQIHIICSTVLSAQSIYQELRHQASEVTVQVLVGSDNSSTKMQVAEDWREGKLDILITSTCALMGNENRKCKHIFIVDLIYDMSNLLQAIGRLRKEQGGVNSFVTQFVSCTKMANKKFVEETTKAKLESLSNMGALREASVDSATSILTMKGLVDFFNKDGCLLRNLSQEFGYMRDEDCKRCTNCDKAYGTTNATIQGTSPEYTYRPTFLNASSTIDESTESTAEPAYNATDPSLTECHDIQRAVSTPHRTNNQSQSAFSNLGKRPSKAITPTSEQQPPSATRRKTRKIVGGRLAAVREREEQWNAAQKQLSKKEKSCYRQSTEANKQNRLQIATDMAREMSSEDETKRQLANKNLRRLREDLTCPFCNNSGIGQCNGDGDYCIASLNFACITCNEKGHRKANCPMKVQRKDDGGWSGNEEVSNFMMEKQRGCFICYDPQCTEKQFNPTSGKHHAARKRIKGALFKEMRRTGKNFISTLKQCYETEETRNDFFSRIQFRR